MAILHFINYRRGQNPAATRFVLHYITQEKKTVADGEKYVTGVGCCAQSALTEFQNTKRLFHQEGGRQFYHLVQSFSPEEPITPAQAHEIALEFAEKCPRLRGFELVAATHCDRDHIHTHFVFNSVSAETGKKFHICQKDVEEMMVLSDEIVTARGFSALPPPRKQNTSPMSDREYRTAERGESWKIQLAAAITDAMEQAGNMQQFRSILELEGYGITWTAERKYITYTCPNGKKCRDSRLHEEKYRKENMEYEFRIREEIYGRAGAAGTAAGADRREGDPLRDGDGNQLGGPAEAYAAAASDAPGGGETAGNSGYGGSAGELYESAAGNSAGGGEECPGGCPAIPGESSAGNAEIHKSDGESLRGAFQTGWEHERSIWKCTLTGAAKDAEIYREGFLDLPDSHGDYFGLVLGTADLVSDVMSMGKQEKEVQDGASKKYRKKEQKHTGPSMGGM